MNKLPFQYSNIYFIPCAEGWQLSRYPQHINELIGHTTAYQHHATSFSFIPKSTVVFHFKVKNTWGIAKAIIQYGNWYECREIDLVCVNGRIEIEPFSFDSKRKDVVVTLYLTGESIVFESIEGDFEAYQDDRKSILFYGTSITQGVGGIYVPSTYANLVAQGLDMKMYNYGLAGNALLEPELIDHFLSEGKYDMIVYECSVNLLLRGCSAIEFYTKVKYLLEQTMNKQPNARVMVTSILPFYEDLGLHNSYDTINSDATTFRRIVEELCREFVNVIYLDPMVLLCTKNLSKDLIHPSDEGMQEIAMNLIRIAKGE